ncbi:assimilatory nitrate reductase catalytic subunit [Nitrospirillum pindoramense]|uniref:Assimilatory nitrate reductase catalytic subunit n=2 Tax=Nitrospirillum amazonense TaxID=28077 RepID=A0A560HJ57_9PROT|nr:assimilatory nitrate reductase catalytic subunit [Nitrospirillum amazonense]
MPEGMARDAEAGALAGTVRSTCPYCGVGCGVVAQADGRVVGDTSHPANRGRLCSKGSTLAETLKDGERLTRPLIDGRAADWTQALDLVAQSFKATIAEHGPDSVAFYVSGQCLTEDYYVANKLMKGFIGSGNIDTNSRLCMASSVAGHNRAFGADVVPGTYEDLELADLVVLVGSNSAWCHPVLHQRLLAAKAKRPLRIVAIDPRRTATCEDADLHLAVRPGADVALFNGLLAHLADQDALDHTWMAAHAEGFEPALAAARRTSDQTAALTGLDPADLARFYHWFASTTRVVTVYSQGVNQSSVGTDKVNAIINCHLATGRIGKPGCGPFSITGQPNAMGGREVGGLANQLAAHMRFDQPEAIDRVRRFWRAPNLATKPGLKAVEMFDAVLDGRIKALWIIATNPADSLPRADRVREALRACPFVVVSDCWPNDTTALADVVLPAAGWGERDGTVTNSERVISRQRPFRAAPGEARADWRVLAALGQRMGWKDAFSWTSPAAVFREHAALSGFENAGSRPFDISGLAMLTDGQYDTLAPVRWPVRWAGDEGGRLFGQGGFATPSGRGRLVPTPWRPPASRTDDAYPLVLNTGRIRDQWHTMTRTGRVPRLLAHTGEPRAALSPSDAARLGVTDGDLVRIESVHASTVVRATVDAGQRVGELFLPMHWTDEFCSAGPAGRLVSAALDPVSGQPELKLTPVRAEAVQVAWRGLLLHRNAVRPQGVVYWSRVPLSNGHAFELVGSDALPDGAALTRFVEGLLHPPTGAEWLQLTDAGRGLLRVAILVDGRLEACLFLAAGDGAQLPSRDVLAALLGDRVPDAARPSLLSGRAPGGLGATGVKPAGRTVCACFSVGLVTIRDTIVANRLTSAEEIGACLKAGTNCGSCIPELKEILRDVHASA